MRNEWVVQYPASKIGETASRRSAYHNTRKAWWDEAAKAAEAALRERGIDIREYQQTGAPRMQAVLDTDLSNRLGECQHKSAGHHSKRETYQRWAEFLFAMGDSHIDLTQADYEFFFTPQEEQED